MIGSMVFSSLKYLRTFKPFSVMAYTILFLPTVFSSTRPWPMRKSRYCLRTLQFTFALYMMWVSFRGPLWARTLRMSIYISSFDLRMVTPLLGLFSSHLYILFTDLNYGFFGFIFG
jgi:hypothetical protein